jgi:hypothetical protein
MVFARAKEVNGKVYLVTKAGDIEVNEKDFR